MKRTNGKLFGVAIVTLIMFAACQKKQNDPAFNPTSNQQQAGKAVDSPKEVANRTAWFPVGTAFKPIPDGFHAAPPEGWSYIGTTTAGKVINLQDKVNSSITCTCNMGVGSCKPFSATGPWGTTKGCTGNCSNCTMSQSLMQHNPYDILSGGYFQPNAPSRLLQNGESIPAVFDELLNHPEFQQRLKSFYQNAYGGHETQKPVYGRDGSISAPDGYALIGASIMGRGLAVIVPEGFAKRQLGYAPQAKASCNCSNNTGGCNLNDKTILGMGSVWCDGTCNGCTLTTNSKLMASVNTYHINIFNADL